MKLSFCTPQDRHEKKERNPHKSNMVHANCGGAYGVCPDCSLAGNTEGCGRVWTTRATWSGGARKNK